jgi:hypothetical protein
LNGTTGFEDRIPGIFFGHPTALTLGYGQDHVYGENTKENEHNPNKHLGQVTNQGQNLLFPLGEHWLSINFHLC